VDLIEAADTDPAIAVTYAPLPCGGD